MSKITKNWLHKIHLLEDEISREPQSDQSLNVMGEPEKQWMPRWMIVGFVVMGVASFSGLAALIIRAIEKIKSGVGLATYRTVWLVEFNHIGVLVLFGAILVASCIGGVMRCREYRDWRGLEKKYGNKHENT